ncbi:hypothetical protein HPTD01_2108 [Halomonas sp. TD01]|nr:hypothetical protein HPTD01_2108 [Halomonas sp. TD01]
MTAFFFGVQTSASGRLIKPLVLDQLRCSHPHPAGGYTAWIS